MVKLLKSMRHWADNPALVNEDAVGDGWFVKIAPSDTSQMDEYMSEAAYQAHIA